MNERDAIDSWLALYQRDIAPPIDEAAGEKSLAMIIQESGVDNKTARTLIEQWVSEGVIVFVGLRRNSRGRRVEAWKLVT